MPSARRQALFALFLSPLGQKVRRLAGRDPSILISRFYKDKEQGQQINHLLP
jgi:hypothetical protein